MSHIELARWADLVLIAPATAEIMARLAGGGAPDLLTTLCLATEAPIAIAPAMNSHMFAHPAVTDALAQLESWGSRILPTDERFRLQVDALRDAIATFRPFVFGRRLVARRRGSKNS